MLLLKKQKNVTNSTPKQLARAERLEQFLSKMEIPKYWIPATQSFLVCENEVNMEEPITKESFKMMESVERL